MNLQALYRESRRRLKEGGIESPDLEARLILKHALKTTDAALIAGDDRTLTAEELAEAESILSRRLAAEPLSRIFGEREFWGMPFTVTPATLDPRPDTETLIEAVLDIYKDGPPPQTILDMGTGSGCILAALLKEFPESRGVGLDFSPAALAVAGENLRRNGLADRARLVQGSWNHDFKGEMFDLLVSNPPYIPSGEIANLDPGVRNHDPILALDGGTDGLEAYKSIIRESGKLFHRHSRGFLEVGVFQAEDVARLVEDAGFAMIGVRPDLAGILRVVIFGSGEK